MKASERALWSTFRSPLEHWVEGVLSRLEEEPRAAGEMSAEARVVVLGGGTGLSTVLGGNSALPAWAGGETEGLLREFSHVTVGVCTTDDGGSTGELVRRLPMIGIGDLRKVMLSSVDRGRLAGMYGGGTAALETVRRVFRHRFGLRAPTGEELRDPVRVLDAAGRRACPPGLRTALGRLTRGMGAELERRLRVPGHCLGNLLLTAAAFRHAGDLEHPPTAGALEKGLDEVAGVMGVPRGRVNPVTAAPGTLVYEYANGVVATGQSRAARARRGCAVRRVRIAFSAEPKADARLVRALRGADLIVYAPGSLYSSMLPVLLTPGVAEAIRANRRAVKVLGANLWIQEGETDVSFREESRGFWVSELIEAYGRHVPGGIRGLFDVVLAASLDTVPGSIIRNYALEGKHPIHLDRARVAELGVAPVEASLFPHARWQRDSMIHHDPSRFAAAVRTLFEGLSGSGAGRGRAVVRRRRVMGRDWAVAAGEIRRGPSAYARMADVRVALEGTQISPRGLWGALEEFFWENPDVRGCHLAYVKGVETVREGAWKRSRAWDNVLGYFEPETGRILLHESLLADAAALKANFAVALGESLLGRYAAAKRWVEGKGAGCKVYELELAPESERACFLSAGALRRYLRAAKMTACAGRPERFRRAVPGNDGFLPCGILFGLMFAWYLNNAYAPALEFETGLVQWAPSRLLPYQVRERTRYKELIRFFREEVFQNG